MSLRMPVTIIGTVIKMTARSGVCSSQNDEKSVWFGAPKAIVGWKVAEAVDVTESDVLLDCGRMFHLKTVHIGIA